RRLPKGDEQLARRERWKLCSEDFRRSVAEHDKGEKVSNVETQPAKQRVVASPSPVCDRPRHGRKKRKRNNGEEPHVVEDLVAAVFRNRLNLIAEPQHAFANTHHDSLNQLVIGLAELIRSLYDPQRKGENREDKKDKHEAKDDPLNRVPPLGCHL